MTDEYTPTVKEARSCYEEGRIATRGYYDEGEFDRMVAAVERATEAKTLREVAEGLEHPVGRFARWHEVVDALLTKAERLEDVKAEAPND